MDGDRLLDSGPLGMVTNPKAKGLPFTCQHQFQTRSLFTPST
jgi:hypothetical protein